MLGVSDQDLLVMVYDLPFYMCLGVLIRIVPLYMCVRVLWICLFICVLGVWIVSLYMCVRGIDQDCM